MRELSRIVVLIIIIGGTIGSMSMLNLFSRDIDKIQDFNKNKIFIDFLGRRVRVPDHPNRIISMAPSITEILYALEVNDRLIGVTDYCNYPEDAKTKPSIGGFSTPNLETIVSLEPDLVISAKDNSEIIKTLENYNIPIIVIISHTLDEIIDDIKDIGLLVDAEEKAKDVTDAMMIKMNLIVFKIANLNENEKLKCYFEVWETPKVAGAKSFLDDMIDKAGGINIFGDLGYEFPTVSHEAVIERNPDVIFVTAHARDNYACDIREREGYDIVNAVINNRICECDDDMFLRAGPRIVNALERMALYLHPTLYN